jgi:hypothetical protein
MGNSTSQFIQIEVPVVNQLPDRFVSDHQRIEKICLQRSTLTLLKVSKMLAYRFQAIAAGASDPDDDLWRALALAHATYPTDKPSLERTGQGSQPLSNGRLKIIGTRGPGVRSRRSKMAA